MARLILTLGPAVDRIYRLKQGANVIGRGKKNEIFVLDKSLSRKHARLRLQGQRASIEDLASKNGTFVDGERVEQRQLGETHSIRCGDVRFRFERSGRPATEPEPTLTCDVGRDGVGQAVEQLTRRVGGTAATVLAATQPALRHWQRRLELLLAATELISAPGPLDELLARVLDLCHELLDVDQAMVLLDRHGELQPTAARGPLGEPEQATFSQQIARWITEHGQAALFDEPLGDPRIADGASIEGQAIAAAMGAPLLARGRAHGVLYVDKRGVGARLRAEDLELLAAFARQAAVAIDNAELSARLADEAVARSNLMRFFPPQVSQALMESGGVGEPVETPACVLFCDICGFTELCGRLAPRQVIALLNGYFPPLAEIVFQHGGTLEKYIGDALLAVWGAPFACDDDAGQAVAAASAMQGAVAAMPAADPGGSPLEAHIGIGSGVVAAGNVGSDRFLQYATVGEATNLASRICGVAGPGQIVVDEGVAARLAGRWPLRSLGPVALAGKLEPVRLHEVGWR